MVEHSGPQPGSELSHGPECWPLTALPPAPWRWQECLFSSLSFLGCHLGKGIKGKLASEANEIEETEQWAPGLRAVFNVSGMGMLALGC